MESQYLNDSPETIAVQFEFALEIHKTFNTVLSDFVADFSRL